LSLEIAHIEAQHECDHFACDLFPEDNKMRGLLFSNDFKKLTIEPHKFRRRLFIGLPEQSKDIVKRLCVRTLDDFHAERNLLSTASQLLFQVMPPRALQGREIVLFAMRREFDDRVWQTDNAKKPPLMREPVQIGRRALRKVFPNNQWRTSSANSAARRRMRSGSYSFSLFD
jgi:hypothetical protein